MTSEDEAELIRNSQSGDLTAFNSLVRAYQDQVYSICLRFLGSREAAEDAAQEAFISAFKAISHFRSGNFRAWLLRIATNACYDELRRRQRRPTTPLEEAFDVPAQNDPYTPEAYAQQRELAGHIQRGLATLPMDQRLAVILCDVQGYSYEEIAQITGSSLGTVKSRINRGRRRLAEHLKNQRELLPFDGRHISEDE